MKILIVVFLITIIYSLGSALIFLVRDHGEGGRTVKRLTWRIALSLVLFISLWVAYQLGWI
ncbi:MAG: twin transmembrane helix small protein, partial [Gammaproteobacteria bacterium]|nr:twin transmembrane helix small protein [Gammaproteobacteria bacterium]